MFCDVNLLGRVSKPAKTNERIKSCLAVGFSVAYQSTQKQDDRTYKSYFVDCICFGKTAERALERLEKGVMVSIRGQLSVDSYQKQDGNWVNFTQISVEKMLILSPKKDEGNSAGGYQKLQQAQRAQNTQQSGNPYGGDTQKRQKEYNLNNYDTDLEELPF